MKLHIDLQDGFAGDELELRVAAQAPLRIANLTTDRMLGLARSLTVEVPAGSMPLVCTLPRRGLRTEARIDAARTPYVALRVEEGALRLYTSAEAFGYL